MNASSLPTPENIVTMPRQRERRAPQVSQRFRVVEFANRSGSTSFRVTGIKRDGTRVRDNFSEIQAAQCRQVELETEYLRGHAETTIRATKLSAEQIQLAEVAFIKLGDDWKRLLDAVDHWNRSGAQNQPAESPRIDEAVEQFKAWLDSSACDLADHTKSGYRLRVGMFGNSIPNLRVSEIAPKTIQRYLAARAGAVDKTTVKNDRRAICRFLSWCIEKEWIATNPALGPRQRTGGKRTGKLPDIFTVEQCEALLQAAQAYKGGMLAPYVAVCLFAGLRPDSEAERITWKNVNLADRQISITPEMTKTGIPRTITIDETLAAWLEAFQGIEFYPSGWRKNFDAVKRAAGIQKWIVDGMRHTAHSHYFRRSGSYGLTAEFFGNSEGIVRKNYVNRVSSEETKRFYAIMPTKKGEK